ncbi:hypothetical protein DCC81_20800 [Chitinophaga parva]|uniref:Ig-like domain-containing protein n=2 Tax=Chitinophaga parva TaxID=2169414 RepID=A0A2T7BCR0_9BACT|nr:hypothetical protein DCC81_20800 [Chitinophaga parva]
MATLQGTGIEEDYATESNTELVNIISPISFSIDQALGWVCPGKSDSSGAIIVTAKGGVPNTSGTYLYKLALAGQAQAGPYLDSNYTGRFEPATTGANYRLVKNHNYEVWVGDECKASKIQGVQVLDFATAQVASSDKPEYCYGDDVMLSVINLPSKATTFRWTYPDGEISTVQNPFISNVDANDAGVYHVVISSDICENPILADVNVVLAPYIISCYSAVTDTSVNPYAYGLLGNWHQSTSYVYYGARASSDPAGQTDIRHDGTFADFTDFLSFWSDQDAGKTDTTKWVWNATSTMFNKYGFELENKDPLGRYNAGIYGYDDALAVAVVQNSRFREAAFDGFEDYYFKSGNCDEACPASRSFDFSLFKNKLDSTQSHSGRYSMRVVSGDSVGIMANVTDTDLEGSTPSFVYGYNTCIGKNGLQSVRTNANILVPVFEPMGNKQVLISAWVKEAQNCQCTSYTNSQIHIAFKSSDNDNATIVIAKPAGAIIDGWQRIEQVVTLPPHTVSFSVALEALGSGAAYFDDIRIHPYNANMKSFVYDPQNLRLMAELDENNYATFYEYDDDGTLIRVKRETERGIKTITETRSALIKQ